MSNESSFYHNFVDEELLKRGFLIKQLDEKYINLRLSDCMAFVNGILEEYKDVYTQWTPKPKEWFLNAMNRKWEFSFVIESNNNEISLFNFTSVYVDRLHNHCTYVNKNCRSLGLAKLHLVKICQKGLDCGFHKYEGYWDKDNIGSIILHLKIGFKIEDLRKLTQLLMFGNLLEIRNKAFDLYKKETH